ncbi:MAG: hypothetical protein GY822_22870 [Deltaproteobacteria bacterium]|nr:hypothetical protein [Deltaproteobacteria bacterium]
MATKAGYATRNMAGDDGKDLSKSADFGTSTSDDGGSPPVGHQESSGGSDEPVVDVSANANHALAERVEPEELEPSVALGSPEQLGFDLRFEAGKALLALEGTSFQAGVDVKKALFEVPDVAFPLDVSSGAGRFQGSRLNLRAIELGIAYERLFLVEALEKVGLTLHRERMRGGGIEFLLSMKGPDGDVPFRAHALVVPAGEAGIALVMHEVIPFAQLPRARLSLAPQLLDALNIPGGAAAEGMVRRADPFAAVLKKLLPAYGWKVPSVASVRVEEVSLKRGEILLRAWSGEIPDGWKAPRRQKRAALKDAIALALFAKDLAKADGHQGRLQIVDRLLDEDALSPAAIPFAAEVLRADERRRVEGDLLVENALKLHPEHLGVLSAAVDDARIDGLERAKRLLKLAEIADLNDEVWVASRAWLSAAHLFRAHLDVEQAAHAAGEAYEADPTLAEAGMVYASTMIEQGKLDAALKIAKATVERLVDLDVTADFCLEISNAAMTQGEVEVARHWLHRGLRDKDREPLLQALARVETSCGELDVAAEFLTRLLLLDENEDRAPKQRAEVQLLAAGLSIAQGDRKTAKAQLSAAAKHLPRDEEVAQKLAGLHSEEGEVERALDALAQVLDEDEPSSSVLLLAASLRLKQATESSGKRVQALLERLPEAERNTPEALRLSARATALFGDVLPLATQLERDAEAIGDEDKVAKAKLWQKAFELLAQAGESDRAAKAFASMGTSMPAEDLANALLKSGDRGALRELIRPGLLDDKSFIRALSKELLLLKGDDEALEWLVGFEDIDDDRFVIAHAHGEEHRRPRKNALLRMTERSKKQVDDNERMASFKGLARIFADEGNWKLAAENAAQAVALGSKMQPLWTKYVEQAHDASTTILYLSSENNSAEMLSIAHIRQARDLLEERAEHPMLRTKLAESLLHETRALEDDDEEAHFSDADALVRSLREIREGVDFGMAQSGLALRFHRADWLKESAGLLTEGGEDEKAASLFLKALDDDKMAKDLASPAMVFAEERSLLELLRKAAQISLTQASESQGERASVFEFWLRGIAAKDDDETVSVATSWLEEDAGAWFAAQALLKDVCNRKALEEDRKDILSRWAKAYEAKRVEEAGLVIAELENLAENNGFVEAFALNLILEIIPQMKGDVSERRAVFLERLAYLAHRDGNLEQAASLLHTRIDCGDPGRFEAWNRMGDWLLESESHASDAIAAFEEALRIEPDALGVSEKLLRLLADHHERDAVKKELRRRVRVANKLQDKAVLWRRLGVYLRDICSEPMSAMEANLRGLRHPHPEEWTAQLWQDELIEECRRLPSPMKWMARLHLAAMHGAEGDDLVISEHAIEAATLFAGVLQRPRFALTFYRVAGARGNPSQAESASWAQVELFRALGDAEGALAVLSGLMKLVNQRRQPDVLDVKAGVLSGMHGDVEGALSLRRSVAEKWPSHRGNALQLERLLREDKELLEAFAVRKKVAELDDDVEFRVHSYLLLVERAEEELFDTELSLELIGKVIDLEPNVSAYRLQRIHLAERLGRYALVVEDSGVACKMQELPTSDRIALALKRAEIQAGKLDEPEAAVLGLGSMLELTENLSLRFLLTQILDEVRSFDEALQLLEEVLEQHPDGVDAFGSRREILEWMARLLERAGRESDAFEALCEAAALGRPSDESALRLARLAEWADDDVNALTALEWILERSGMDPEHRLSMLGRQALLAERVGRFELALTAWRGRAERMPNDLSAWRGVERVAQQVEEPDARREAARSLLRLEHGERMDRASRLLFLARDGRTRGLDGHLALSDLSAATELVDDVKVRRERVSLAIELADDAEVFAAFDHMRRQGDKLSESEWLQSAQASARVQQPRRALESALQAMERGIDTDGNVMTIFERVAEEVQPQLGLAVVNRYRRDDEVAMAIVQRILPYLQDIALLPSEVVAQLAGAFPEETRFVRRAAEDDREAGEVIRAVDRILLLAESRVEEEATELESLAAGWLLDSNGDVGTLLGRLDALLPVLASTDRFRVEALRLLRDGEAWPGVVRLLELAVDVSADDVSRVLRLELVDVLRSELEEFERSAAHLERLLVAHPEDRQAWGALLETLEELEEYERLADALGRRAGHVSGIEQRELVRRRIQLSLEHHYVEKGLLDQISALRNPQTGADDFDEFYWEILGELGSMTLRRALLDEVKNGDTQAIREQAANRLLSNAYFPSLPLDQRVQCRLVAAGADVERAIHLVDDLASQSADQCAKEAVEYVTGLFDEVRGPAAIRLLQSASHWGSAELLNAAERFFAAEIARDDEKTVLLSAARALKVRSGNAAQTFLSLASGISEDVLARSALHRALRAHAVDELMDLVTSSAVGEEQADSLSTAVFLEGSPSFSESLSWKSGDLVDVDLAANFMRVAPISALSLVEEMTRTQAAHVLNRLARLSVTDERVPAFVVMVEKAGGIATEEFVETLARVAVESGLPESLRALDVLLGLPSSSSWAMGARAQIAVDENHKDAAAWCAKAADLVDDAAQKHRWHRESASQYLLLGENETAGNVLRTWVGEEPSALPAALELARAAGLDQLVDDLFQHQEAGDLDIQSVRIAAKSRASHRLQKMNNPLGAFEILYQAALTHDDTELFTEAYECSVREGLLLQRAEASRDPLAKAACLLSIGKAEDALKVLHDDESLSSSLLKADAYCLLGDVEAELKVLTTAVNDAPTRGLRQKVHELRRQSQDTDEAWQAFFAGSVDAALWKVVGKGFTEDFSADNLSETVANAAFAWNDGVNLPDVTRLLVRSPATNVAARLALSLELARNSREPADWVLWLDLVQVTPPDEINEELFEAAQVAETNKSMAAHSAWEVLFARCPEPLLEKVAASVSTSISLKNTLLESLLERNCIAVLNSFLDDTEGFSFANLLKAALKIERADVWLDAVCRWPERVGKVELPLWFSPKDRDRALVVLHLAGTFNDEELLQKSDAAFALGEASLLLADYILRLQPLHQGAWKHIANSGSAKASFFAASLSLRQGTELSNEISSHDEKWSFVDALRTKSVRSPQAPPLDGSVGRYSEMRQQPRALRVQAWEKMANEAVSTGHDLASMRFLNRAGRSLDEVELGLRLRFDPELRAPHARSAFVSKRLQKLRLGGGAALETANGGDSDVVILNDAFQELVEKGQTNASERAAVFGVDLAVVPQITDAYDAGWDLDAKEIVQSIRPSLAQSVRRVAAASLRHIGLDEVAESLLPTRTRTFSGQLSLRSASYLGLLKGTSAASEQQLRTQLDNRVHGSLLDSSFGRELAVEDDVQKRASVWRQRLALDFSSEVLLLEAAAKDTLDAELTEDWLAALSKDFGADETIGEGTHGDDEPDAALGGSEALVLSEALALNLSLPKEPALKTELLLRLARLLRIRLRNPIEALAVLESYSEEVGRNPSVLKEIAACAEAAGQKNDAAQRLKLAAIALDPADPHRHELRRRAASLFEAIDDIDEAVALLSSSVEDEDEESVNHLEKLCERNALAEPLLLVLRYRLLKTSEENRRDASLALAWHLAHPLARRGEAIAVLESQAMLDADDRKARLVLARWYEDERRILDAALALESASTTGDVNDAEAAEAAANAAILLSVLGNLERAGPLASRALGLGVDNVALYSVAEAWYREQNMKPELDELLGKQLLLVDNLRLRAQLWLERSELRSEYLAGDDAAHEALLECLQCRPDQSDAVTRLKVYALRHEEWAEYRAVLSRAVEVSDDDVLCASWLQELAFVDSEHLNDSCAAQNALERAAVLAPDSGEIALAQARLAAELGRIEAVPALLQRARDLGLSNFEGSLLLAEGDGFVQAGERDRAVDAFRMAKASDDVAEEAQKRLLDLAKRDGGPLELAHALGDARARAEGVEEKIAMAREEAVAWREADDDDRAASVWQLVLDAEPAAEDALDALRGHFLRKRKLDVFAGLLRAAADFSVDKMLKAKRLSELGDLLVGELGAEAQARKVFEEALTHASENKRALAGLANTAVKARHYKTALPLLNQLEEADWPAGNLDLLFSRACAALDQETDDVETRLRAVLKIDPAHIGALEHLVRWAKKADQLDAQEFALESLCNALNLREDPTKLAYTLVELSAVRRLQGQVAAATAAIERAYELEPTSERVLVELVAVRKLGDDENLLEKAMKALAPFMTDDDRIAYERKRVEELEASHRLSEAAGVAISLLGIAGASNVDIATAMRLAMASGEPSSLSRMGLAARSTEAPVDVLQEQITGFVSEGEFGKVLDLLMQAAEEDPENQDHAVQGMSFAAKGTGQHKLFFGSRVLTFEKEKGARMDAALLAGRAARDELLNQEKAAELLFEAHQCAPENLELRLELTSLYAKMKGLLPRAQTGVVQLLKRAPTDGRVYGIAAEIADQLEMLDMRASMRAASFLVQSKPLTPEVAPPGPLLPNPNPSSVSESDLVESIAPESYQQTRKVAELMRTLGSSVEVEFAENVSLLVRSKRLADVLPTSIKQTERIDQVFPGRPLKILVGHVTQVKFHSGAVLHAILPESILHFGDAVVVAFLARTFAVARLGGVTADECSREEMVSLRRLLVAAFVEPSDDEAVQKNAHRLFLELPEEVKAQAFTLASTAFHEEHQETGRDVMAWRDGVRTLADRFALLVSGSLPGALAAGALPGLLSDTPSITGDKLMRSERAIDLCRFAAGTEVWALRRSLGLLPPNNG